jgi:ATP-dependent Lon protease
VSGGKATPASLFYNKASRKLGVIGLKQLVFFDEIANTRFDDAEASISMLKDYMQTGKFSRGDQEFTASCSVVLGGNIDTNLELRQPDPRYSHLFQVLPLELQDPAFLDRIHAYLPGWEMPKIRPENYSTGYGLLTDYMAEIFAELRRRNFQTHVNACVDMGDMTGRNQDAIKKTTAGLLTERVSFPRFSRAKFDQVEVGLHERHETHQHEHLHAPFKPGRVKSN